MGKMVVKCPDCDTKFRLKEEGSREIEPIPDKSRKAFPKGKEIETTGAVEDVSDYELQALKDLYAPKVNKHVTTCLLCEDEVSLYLSYLVKIQTKIFPKKEERFETLSPAGIIVEEIKITRLPPVKEKGRMCNKCFNSLPIIDFTEGRIELLSDPMNMTRDGLRNVKDVPVIRYEQDIIEKEEPKYEPPPGAVKDEDIVLEFGVKEQERFIAFVKGDQNKVVERKRRAYLLKPSRINVNLHPSRRVRRINIPQFPKVEFAPNKERRNAFKRWFENG